MLLFNLILFLFWSGILFWILKYRIHVHINMETPKKRRPVSLPGNARYRGGLGATPAGMQHARDIAAALQGQGLKAMQAKAIAARVCSSYETDFDVLLRKAIQEAAA